MRVDVRNTDDKIWDFTLLLHTHLKVEDIAKTKIRGLDKVSYIDKLKRGSNATHVGDVIITEAIDRSVSLPVLLFIILAALDGT